MKKSLDEGLDALDKALGYKPEFESQWHCGCKKDIDGKVHPCQGHQQFDRMVEDASKLIQEARKRDEVRIVDKETGGMKGQKLARFDMIPPDVLWELAEHYGKGSIKYPDVECECVEIAELLLGTTPEDFAKIVTCNGGEVSIQVIAQHIIEESKKRNTTKLSKNLAGSVELRTSHGTLITITLVVSLLEAVKNASVDPFAIRATSPLEFLKELVPNGRTKHLIGCQGGTSNWMRGYDYRLSVAAMQRHFHQWLMGEEFDPETGSHHLIACMWHCAALRWYVKHGKGKDYRKQE